MPAAPRPRRDGPVYVVEHLEEGLDEWCRLEYRHICQVVPPERVLFTRWQEEMSVAELSTAEGRAPGTTRQTLTDLVKAQAAASGAADAGAAAETPPLPASAAALTSFDRICLLDMAAEEALQPEDAAKFDAVVFGGILGNITEEEDGTYGSDDRTAEIRPEYTMRRHLGPMQMTTDTAVLVTRLVLEEARPLAELPFLDSPEIPGETSDESLKPSEGGKDCVCMEGFRYVGRRAADGDWEPTLPEGMRELLARDADNDILGSM
eukprot:TRINITY_DN71390_c0_g1_i1.p1 TRINITY_DN71390_c0_g1~~TRINITY_DN71390_c0_g1_i1.p1  ORF type:complete len:264 (-),score=77.64 TRINITY_DN71390_c0_g1_i1:68-859(-)